MRLKRRHFGFNVIKESFDQLPTATCFFDSTGGVVLCNRRMYELSQYLLHSSIQYLAEAEQALASPPNGGCAHCPCGEYVSVSGSDDMEI